VVILRGTTIPPPCGGMKHSKEHDHELLMLLADTVRALANQSGWVDRAIEIEEVAGLPDRTPKPTWGTGNVFNRVNKYA
jgi:hypothetical protein